MDYQIVLSCLKKALEKTFYEFSKKLQESISTNIYQKPKSLYYDRTGEFLQSVKEPILDIKSNGTFTFDFYDTDVIKSKNGTKGKFGHHKSFPWKAPYPSNEEVKDNLYSWLDEGFTILGHMYHEGFNFDVGTAFEKGSPFYERFVENAILEIKKSLERR